MAGRVELSVVSRERWPSGLRRTLGKRVCVKAYPGFESLSLRHYPSVPGINRRRRSCRLKPVDRRYRGDRRGNRCRGRSRVADGRRHVSELVLLLFVPPDGPFFSSVISSRITCCPDPVQNSRIGSLNNRSRCCYNRRIRPCSTAGKQLAAPNHDHRPGPSR